MKSILKVSILVAIFLLSLISCDTHPSLQKYIVDSKENNEFMSFDFSASLLQVKNEDVTEDVKNTLKTIKKINFLALEITESNKDLYTSEKEKIKKILKNPKYKELMRMSIKGGNVSVNYLGEEDSVDEVIIFGSSNEKGLLIARVLGEKMNPSAIMNMAQDINFDGDSGQMKQLKGLLGGIK